jgi:tetratricopeptide (TPR) repeat protein
LHDEPVTSQPPLAGPFAAEHLLALDLLKSGSVEANTPEDERILAALAAAGFAKKVGNAYVCAGSPPHGWANPAREAFGLTPKQKKIICAGIACLGLLVCFLPWNYTVGAGRETPAGYYFIFTPPRDNPAKVDVTRVVIPAAFVVCVTIAAVVLVGGRPRGTTHEPPRTQTPCQTSAASDKPRRAKFVVGLAVVGGILFVAFVLFVGSVIGWFDEPVVPPEARKYSRYYVNWGKDWFDSGGYEKALEAFDVAVAINPKNADAYTYRGHTWLRKQDCDRAIKDFNEAIRLDPKQTAAHTGRNTALSLKKALRE